MLSKIHPAPSRIEEEPLDAGSPGLSEPHARIDPGPVAEHRLTAAPERPAQRAGTSNTAHSKALGPANPQSAVSNGAPTEPAPEFGANDAMAKDADLSYQCDRSSVEDPALSQTSAPAPTDDKAYVNVAAPLGSVPSGAIAERHASKATTEVRQEPEASYELAFPDETTLMGQLEYVLRYGALPPTLSISLPHFMDNLAQALAAQPQSYRTALQKAAIHDVERKRIARLFSPEALSRVWPLLLPAHHAEGVVCLEVVHAAGVACSAGEHNEQLRQTCVEELLHMIGSARQTRWDNAVFLSRTIQRLAENHSLRPAVILEHLRQDLLRQPEHIRQKLGPAVDRAERETAVIPISPARPSASSAGQAPASASPPAPRFQKPSPPFPAGEPFYIGNAGIILLWPFLARYFQGLGLLEPGIPGKDKSAFRDEKERSRAIHLVQYLATGRVEAPEHEMLLNKILCGAPPEQPLDPVSHLTEAEEALSTQMLNAVIDNWPKLRNTSVAGLRQSFLLREGRLLRRDSDDAWSLTVSVKGYDILLDSLPWRFSTVRLPWMQTVLHVKWR
jgi:hypothetical protein